MDFKKLYFVFAALCATVSSAYSQEICKVTPEYFKEGTDVTVIYNPEEYFGDGHVNGVYYCWRDYHWEASDMVLTRQDDGKLKAEFTIPEKTALVVWKFYDRDTVDIGGPYFTYAKFVLTKDGRNMPSANIGWAFLRGENTQDLAGIPSLAEVEFEKKDNEVVRMWINNELRANPGEIGNVFWFATRLMCRDSTASRENMKNIIRNLINSDMSADLDEEQLMKAHKLVSTVLPDSTMKSEIEELLAERYPQGEFFREKEAKELFMSDKTDGFDNRFREFIAKYPPENFENAFVEDDMFEHYYSNLFRIYVYSAITENKDYSRVEECLKISPRGNLATYFWHLVQIPFDRGDVSARDIYPLAKMLYEEMFTRPQTEEEKVWSPEEWKIKLYKDNRIALLDYARILDGAGQSAHAMLLMDTLYTYFGSSDADFNDFYVKMLNDNGRNIQALDIIKDAVGSNQATPEMLDILKEEYVREGNDAASFDAYVNSLKSKEILEAQKEELIASMIDVPTRLFKLESVKGKKVNMASLKGHILVLDFWATWCGPCKAAMPGMQMAVDRYKDDPEVDFFFISTMETRKDFIKVIKDFIAEKGYDFNVLIDNPDENGVRQAVYQYYAKQFTFSGIPQKMIIDGEGNVRWIATGYLGSPSALADEISIIIEEIRKK